MEYRQQDGDSLPMSTPPSRGSTGHYAHGMRFMSSDRPYPCHVCGKRFTQKAHLIIHKRTHTGEKPYPCHICHKRFAQSSHLTVHKRVHTGEKPFFCNFCGMGFCRRPRLEAHILQHMVKEGRELPAGLNKGDALNGLATAGDGEHVNQESLDAAAQLMELKMKGGYFPQVKYESSGHRGDFAIAKANHIHREKVDLGSSSSEDFRAGIAMNSGGGQSVVIDDNLHKDKHLHAHEHGHGHGRSRESDHQDEVDEASRRRRETAMVDGGNENDALADLTVVEELDKPISGLTELTELQKQTLNQTLLMNTSPKGQFNSLMTSHPHHHHQMMSGHTMMTTGSGLTMTGLVRTNSRVSLIDFTAEDILQHLLSRDDIKSCDFCCVIFRDPAMYFLHRSMHDKMDVRCCNLCGKLLKDKYDFNAHFLNQHKSNN